MVDKTAFVSVILHARLKDRLFHPAKRDETRSKTSPEVSLFILFCKIGIPIYFPNSLVQPIPLSPLINLSISLLTLLEKKIFDFSRLTFCPEASQNRSNTRRMIRIWATDASAHRIKSYAKQMCDSFYPPHESAIGFQSHVPTDASIK